MEKAENDMVGGADELGGGCMANGSPGIRLIAGIVPRKHLSCK